MRMVIVSDRGLSRQALTSAFERVPGAVVVAVVDTISQARLHCRNGDADMVVADAASIDGEIAHENLPLDEGVSRGIAQLASSEIAAIAATAHRYPWHNNPSRAEQLSPSEHRVFLLLGMGLSNRQISRILNSTEHTVKTHVGRILTKLEVKSRLQAALVALVDLSQTLPKSHAH